MKRPRAPEAASQLDRAYDGIRSRIVDGTYAGAAPLAEELLARLHGTSRTPVREALARLSQEGYVDRVPGRGYFVARVTVQLIRDTFEIRRLLEGRTAARAAQYATADERTNLARLAEYRYEAGDLAGYRRAEAANEQFHAAIATASHNQVAERLVKHCLMQMHRFIALGVDVSTLPNEANRDHQLIVQAIIERDAAAAQGAMDAHLERSSGVLSAALLRGNVPVDV